MEEGSARDPTKGHLKIIPTINTYQPIYQPTQITRKLENQIFFFEAVGEFLMVYGSTCYKEQYGFDFQFTVAFMMAIVMCNHPSNSNLNPMVTLSFCLRNTKRYQLQLLWIYFKAQFTGAFCGIVLTYMLNGVYRFPFVPKQHSVSEYLRIMLSECVGVFILCFLVLQVVGPNTGYTTNRLSKFLYIAFMIYIGRRFAVTSYTALNAWITLSRAIIGIWKNDWEGLKYYLLWLIGDIIGCVIATYFYNLIAEPCIVHSRVKKMIVHERQHQMIQMETIKHNANENKMEEILEQSFEHKKEQHSSSNMR